MKKQNESHRPAANPLMQGHPEHRDVAIINASDVTFNLSRLALDCQGT
jgi:hypothetical protein